MQQDTQRRFVFRGSAIAFGGQIYRPEGVVLVTHGSSALSVVGGRSTNSVEGADFRQLVTIGSASADVEGAFDDQEKARAMSEHKVREDTLATHTIARATVEGITVGREKRVRIGHVSARMRAESAPGRHQPRFKFPKERVRSRGDQEIDLHIADMVVDGKPVEVIFDAQRFSDDLSTFQKIKSRARSKPFMEQHGVLLDSIGESTRLGRGQVVLVKVFRKFVWPEGMPPRVKEVDNSLVIDDFGTIYFGEMFVTDVDRRLTLVRMKLGSPEGGDIDFAEVQTNGSWFPPIPP